MNVGLLVLLLGCRSGPVLDAGGGVLDLHTHCPPDQTTCAVESLEGARDGSVTAVVAGLSHYAIAQTLGDALPDELSALPDNNRVALDASVSRNVLWMPSLDCLVDTPGSDPDFTAACLEDADRMLAEGAVGFKDHAGKTFDSDDQDIARWVGGYNRLAGWCSPPTDSEHPNLDCLTEADIRFPLEVDAYREVIRGVVQERGRIWLTHAVPFHGSEERCADQACFDRAADALVGFAEWAAGEGGLDAGARRRVVVAHMGFLQDDDVRLAAVLDAGFTVDLAQTQLMSRGCELRALVAEYPGQVVLGTDLMHGPSCVGRTYDAWVYALLGPADESAPFRDTCRGTVRPVGAALDEPDACGISLPAGAGRNVLFTNANSLLGDVE